MLEFNGEYGVMGDLGPHVCVIPLRAGWIPRNVRAVLSNIVTERPDGKGGRVPCETWDNASLLCEAHGSRPPAASFRLSLKTHRIAPGERNNWYIEIYGTQASARYSLSEPTRSKCSNTRRAGEQTWRRIDLGHETAYASITPAIFQFGVSDAILQMWAAFLHELDKGRTPGRFAGCVTPQESVAWHRLFTAALESQASGTTAKVLD